MTRSAGRWLVQASASLLVLAAMLAAAVWWLGVHDAGAGAGAGTGTGAGAGAGASTSTGTGTGTGTGTSTSTSTSTGTGTSTSTETSSTIVRADPALVERGAYLARAGNCEGCHTAQGGAPYAGGRGVPTPFGTVFAPNLTPDPASGLGQWSAADFWRALHHGRARSGRLLYPAFPYPNYTRVSRADADAIFAYLQSLPAVAQANRAHTLGFPFDTQAALAVWRALYFRPAAHVDDPARPAEWNRGAYLVEGLGHCNACHSARNALGATRGTLDLQGGLIPVQNWYAPSLASPHEAGVANWPKSEVVRLLKTGVAAQGFAVHQSGDNFAPIQCSG